MKIGEFDTDKRVMIIAEIGNNHEGSFALAEEMIGRAAMAGAHAVKFQTIVPERLVSSFQTERIEQLRRFQLSYDEFSRLAMVAQQEKVIFLSTPFDLESAAFLDGIVPAFKISSGDNTFYPLLEAVATTAKPVLLSTGLTDLDDIRHSINFIKIVWKTKNIRQDIALMHCVTAYPVLAHEANLLALDTLKGLGVTVGYSDHTLGIDAAVLSVALGARVVEKHFTINKQLSDFRDHQLSADPEEMAQMIDRIQMASEMLGTGVKKVLDCELSNKIACRRSIVARKDLPQGKIISIGDLTWVRPGGGIPPGSELQVLDKTLLRPVRRGEMILNDFLSSNSISNEKCVE